MQGNHVTRHGGIPTDQEPFAEASPIWSVRKKKEEPDTQRGKTAALLRVHRKIRARVNWTTRRRNLAFFLSTNWTYATPRLQDGSQRNAPPDAPLQKHLKNIAKLRRTFVHWRSLRTSNRDKANRHSSSENTERRAQICNASLGNSFSCLRFRHAPAYEAQALQMPSQ